MESTPSARLRRTLERALSRDDGKSSRIAVAYSGGRDSAVLLAVCCQLWPGSVTAVYVDHGWRQESERRDELALVRRVCRRLVCDLRTFGPPEGALYSHGNREALARQFRYTCFESYLGAHPGEVLLLGHHAQDQAETILMRLLRGRSWQGLAGIPEGRGAYRRPFLAVWPEELELVAKELDLEISRDSSNEDVRLARNALRRKILPVIEESFPGAARSLVRFGQVWGELQPPTVIDLRWTRSRQSASIDRRIWDSWSSLERGNQLQALAGFWKPGRRPRRQVDSILTGGESGGLRLRLEKSHVLWETVVKLPSVQYFRETAEGQPVNFGSGEALWSSSTGDVPLDRGSGSENLPVYVASFGALAVRHWVVRFRDSLAPERRESLKSCVYWLVGNEVKGVFDPESWLWLWKPQTSLAGRRIWVTLRRSAYE